MSSRGRDATTACRLVEYAAIPNLAGITSAILEAHQGETAPDCVKKPKNRTDQNSYLNYLKVSL